MPATIKAAGRTSKGDTSILRLNEWIKMCGNGNIDNGKDAGGQDDQF